VVESELYLSSAGTKRYFTVSSAAKLTAGDELKFTVTNLSNEAKATFKVTITKELVSANSDPVKLLHAAMKAALGSNDLNFGTSTVKAIAKNNVTLTSANDAVLVTLAKSSYEIEVETVSEAGTLLVQQSSRDGAGGNVNANITAVQYNEAPDVAFSTSTQELDGVFGAHTLSLSSISVIDDSQNLQVTLAPTRGAHGGFFQFVDTSLFSHFLAEGYVKVQYFDPATNKPVNAADKLPAGVGKLVITASAYTFDFGEGVPSVTYKASDIVNLVLSGVSFQVNRGLFSSDAKYSTGFDLAINDEYTVAANGKALEGTFASSGERMYNAAVIHGTLDDVTGDNRIDANDAVVKVSTLRQLATADNTEGRDEDLLEPGLHMTDNEEDTSRGIDNDLAASKVFSVTNKTLQHAFTSAIGDMMVEAGLTTTSTIFLHADEALQYTMLDYAKAGFSTIYNETTEAMAMTVGEANRLNALGVGVVGDVEILFESSKAETLVAPLRNLQSLAFWDTIALDDATASYTIKNFDEGDKLDLKTLLKIDASKLVLTEDAEAALLAYETTAGATSSFDYGTNTLYAAFNDAGDSVEPDTVDYYYVGWDQQAGEAVTKVHFHVELVGVDLNANTKVDTLKTFLV
jgi:hypothetical protein